MSTKPYIFIFKYFHFLIKCVFIKTRSKCEFAVRFSLREMELKCTIFDIEDNYII